MNAFALVDAGRGCTITLASVGALRGWFGCRCDWREFALRATFDISLVAPGFGDTPSPEGKVSVVQLLAQNPHGLEAKPAYDKVMRSRQKDAILLVCSMVRIEQVSTDDYRDFWQMEGA